MNTLCDLHLAYVGKRNLYGEVREFGKQKHQSENFETVMEWLKNLGKMNQETSQREVIADIKIKYDTKSVCAKTKVAGDACHIFSWEWQDIRDT